jgi:hypothetical protein
VYKYQHLYRVSQKKRMVYLKVSKQNGSQMQVWGPAKYGSGADIRFQAPITEL